MSDMLCWRHSPLVTGPRAEKYEIIPGAPHPLMLRPIYGGEHAILGELCEWFGPVRPAYPGSKCERGIDSSLMFWLDIKYAGPDVAGSAPVTN